MTWNSEVWRRWYELASESNQSSPAVLRGVEVEKWKLYEMRIERELDAARRHYREGQRRTSSAPGTPTQSLMQSQCAPAEHVK
jgi:hypothetical protein